MLREIRALETTHEGPDGGRVSRVRHGRTPRPPRQPRRDRVPASHDRRRTFFTIGVTAAVILALAMFNVSPGAYQIRRLLGFDDRLGSAVDAEGDGAYAFLATHPGTDQPVGWSPCEPIDYVVNPEGAPDDWSDLVEESVDEISEATGLVFDYSGTTDDRDFEGRFEASGSPKPVLIGWATAEEVPGLKGDVAGLAGPISRTNGIVQQYVTGRVMLDSDAFDEIERFRDSGLHQRAIVMHELAHLVGLDHVDDRSELMYPTSSVPDLGAGDRRGLALVGDVPCG